MHIEFVTVTVWFVRSSIQLREVYVYIRIEEDIVIVAEGDALSLKAISEFLICYTIGQPSDVLHHLYNLCSDLVSVPVI